MIKLTPENPRIVVEQSRGVAVVKQPISFHTGDTKIILPDGWVYDGVSRPWWLGWAISRFDDDLLVAAGFHDYYIYSNMDDYSWDVARYIFESVAIHQAKNKKGVPGLVALGKAHLASTGLKFGKYINPY